MAYSVPTSTPDVTVNPDNSLLTAFVNAQKQKNVTLAQQLMQEGSAVSPVYSTAQGMARLGMAGLGGLYGYLDQQGNAKQQAALLSSIGSLQGQGGGSALPGGFSTTPPKDDDEDAKPGKQAAAPGDTLSAAATAIKGVESGGGNYAALGPVTKTGDRAYGAYQVMGANIPSWTARHYGQSLSPEEFLGNKDAQDKVFNGEFGGYLAQHGNINDAASRWFTGRPLAQAGNASDGYNTVQQYVGKVNRLLGKGGQQADAGDVALPAGVNSEYASLPDGASNPIDAAVGPGSANAVDAVRQAGSSVSSGPTPPVRPAELGASQAPSVSPSPGPKALASALSQYNVNPNAADAGAKAFAADPANRGPQYAAALTGKPLASPQAAPQAAPQAPAQYASLPAPVATGGAPQVSDVAQQPAPKPAGTQVAQAGGDNTALKWVAIAEQANRLGNEKLATYAMDMAKQAQQKAQVVYDKDGNMFNYGPNGATLVIKKDDKDKKQIIEDKYGNKFLVNKDDASAKPIEFPGGAGARQPVDPSVTGDEYLKTLPPDEQGLVKKLAAYEISPTSLSIRGGHRERLLAQASQYDPTYDQANYNSRAAAIKEFNTGGPNSPAGQITAGNTAIQHLKQLSDVSQKLGGTGDWGILNAPINRIRTGAQHAANSPDLVEYDNAKGRFAEEATKFYRGVGGSEADIKRALDDLTAAQSPEARNRAIAVQAELMESKINAMQSRLQTALGGSGWKRAIDTAGPDFPIVQKKSAEALETIKNRNNPPVPEQGPPMPGNGPQSAASASPAQPITVQTPADAHKLPPGSRYRTPDGREFIR